MKNKDLYGKESLSVRLPLLLTGSFLIMSLAILTVVFFRFKEQTLDEYTRMAVGVSTLVKSEIDGDTIRDYAKEGFQSEEYSRIAEELKIIYRSYPDIHYLYVYAIKEDATADVLFDVFTEDGKLLCDEPGGEYNLDEPFASFAGEIVAGEQTGAYVVVDEFGERLLSYLSPIKNSDGEYVCSVGVDFSMMYLYQQDMIFLVKTFFMLMLLSIVVAIVDIFLIRRDVTKPLGDIAECTSAFAYETEEDRIRNVQLLEALKITQQDEIGDIYHVFLSVLKDSFYYMSHLEKARRDIKEKEETINYMGKTMYKDELTGVGNKAAYTEIKKEINEKIQNGFSKFAVIMVDINNLKYVNDTFGHEKGDAYISGCCNILMGVCLGVPIYRIGGDEFVLVLQGRSYDIREQLVAKLMIAFNQAYINKNREAYERYAASVGMAAYVKGDEGVETVFKRADTAMYDQKMRFKEKYGSYR